MPRPEGKRTTTHDGCDEVVFDEGFELPQLESADEVEDVLDAREERQTSRRKASGPSGDRTRVDDVLIEETPDDTPAPPPTDPT